MLGVAAGRGTTFSAAELQTPSKTPPASVEGAWVDDDSQTQSAIAQPMMAMPAGYRAQPQMAMPQQGGGQPLMNESAQGGSDVGWGGYCGADGCDCDGCDGSCGGGCGGGPFADDGCFGNLWNEVHSHKRLWVRGEYLNWRSKSQSIPPLVTTAPIQTPQPATSGRLDDPDTSILFGGNRYNGNIRSGGRVNFGYWLVDGEFLGIEGHYMALNDSRVTFGASSIFTDGVNPGDRLLFRPFFNTVTQTQDAAAIAYPNFPNFVFGNLPAGPANLNGSIAIRSTSDVQSAGALIRNLLWIDFTDNYRVDYLYGYRWFRLNDSLIINDTVSATVPNGNTPFVTFSTSDQFFANNQFHGGEFGLDTQIFRGRFSVDVLTKVAMGNNRQTVRTQGATTATTFGAASQPGGLLASGSNIGETRHDMFGVIPEVTVTGRVDITPNVRATIGYNFLWINNVVRSGDQVNLNVDPAAFHGGSGGATPVARLVDTSYYLHGLTGGIEVRY